MVNARQIVNVFNPPLKFDVHNDFIVFSLSLSAVAPHHLPSPQSAILYYNGLIFLREIK